MVELFNIDNMDLMARYPDKYFGLAIIDPPYGRKCDIKTNGKRCAKRNGFSALYINDTGNNWNNAPSNIFFNELFRVSRNQIIWGGNFFTLPPTPSIIVWNKMQRNFSFGDGEMAWCSIGNSLRIFDMSRGEMQKEKRIHITQKPVKLYKWLLDKYANPGDKILDTHGGSMSSVIAAIDMGFDITCCEIDKDYFNAAVKRIKEHIAQLDMFNEIPEILIK